MAMGVKSENVASILRSMTPTALADIWREAGCAPANDLAAFTDEQLLDALFERGVDQAEAIERLKLTADHFPQNILALAIEKDVFLDDHCSSLELLEYVDEDDLLEAADDLNGKVSWQDKMDQCRRKTDFETNPLEREKILAALGVADVLIAAMTKIEKGDAHAAHRVLDQLINPRWRSRSAKFVAGPDRAEWVDLVTLALPYVETAKYDQHHRDSMRACHVLQLMKRMRKAIEATEATSCL